MRNVKVNKIYNHQKSGESANSEVQQEKNSKRCKKNLKYQSKTVDRLLPISVFFFLPTSVAAKSHLHSGRVLLSPTQAKIVKDGRAWPKPKGWRGDGKRKSNILMRRKQIFYYHEFASKAVLVFILKYYVCFQLLNIINP